MNIIMKRLACVLMFLVAAAFVALIWWTQGGQYHFGEYGNATSSVKTQLNDPGSAHFESLSSHVPGVVCGLVNAKNLMGAYTGYTMFEVDTRHGFNDVTIMGQANDNNPARNAIWYNDCGVTP